jgi:hypothetical protein
MQALKSVTASTADWALCLLSAGAIEWYNIRITIMLPTMIDPKQRQLLTQFESRRGSINPNDPRSRTPSGFVLDHGWWYAPAAKPEHIAAGTPNECFANAFWLALDNPSLIYCEGFALDKGAMNMTHHAWVTDGEGRAIDTTWNRVGVAYAGVPFDVRWLNRRGLQQRSIICVLDDWQNNWPILGELGNRPDEWIEWRGCGVSKVTSR